MPQLAGGDGQGPRRAARRQHAARPPSWRRSSPASPPSARTLAGELHGLRVLFENIEDDPDNETRFFVIGREPARRSGDDKTAIMFTTAHKPGALAEVLDVFKENGINLTDIEKRPSKKVNWEYYFFIDAQGHGDDAGDENRHRAGAAALPAIDGAGELSAGDGSAVAVVRGGAAGSDARPFSVPPERPPCLHGGSKRW